MPQKWQGNWVIPGYEDVDVDEADPDYRNKMFTRNRVVNTFGNLTLLTQKLNSSVSNGPYKVKMPAIRAHSSLALNRDLNAWNHWDEDTIRQRGEMLFKEAQKIWLAPQRKDGFVKTSEGLAGMTTEVRKGFPKDGTKCDFTYGETIYRGEIVSGSIVLAGVSEQFGSFSAASKHITKTSRNGWNDWYLDLPNGQRMLADHWRKSSEA